MKSMEDQKVRTVFLHRGIITEPLKGPEVRTQHIEIQIENK